MFNVCRNMFMEIPRQGMKATSGVFKTGGSEWLGLYIKYILMVLVN